MLNCIYKYLRKNTNEYKKIKYTVSFILHMGFVQGVYSFFLDLNGVKPNYNAALVT